MRFIITNQEFCVLDPRRSEVRSATILGVEENEHQKAYFLDRLIDINPDKVPDGWKLSGCISTIAVSQKIKT